MGRRSNRRVPVQRRTSAGSEALGSIVIIRKGRFGMSGQKWILFIDGNDNERGYYADRLRTSSPDYEIFQAVN